MLQLWFLFSLWFMSGDWEALSCERRAVNYCSIMIFHSCATSKVLEPGKINTCKFTWMSCISGKQVMNCAYMSGMSVIMASLYSRPGISALWRKQSPFLNNKIISNFYLYTLSLSSLWIKESILLASALLQRKVILSAWEDYLLFVKRGIRRASILLLDALLSQKEWVRDSEVVSGK